MPSKTVLITGGAKGIGYAIARQFISEGTNVVIADIDETAGANCVTEFGSQAVFVKTDVSKTADVQNLVGTAIKTFGSIDVLINNAAVVHAAEFLDLTETDFDRVIGINLKGAFMVGQAVAKQMVKQIEQGGKPGAIVNMSSVNAVFAIANQVPYSVSKGGVSQLTKVMALALAPYGIRVNAIGPGSIMTDMLASVNSNPEAKARILSRTPLGRNRHHCLVFGV
jgi:glucose 1-dehydrogenase